MKFRKARSTTGETKVEIQMTPMLDMIFQLLVFFILTFKPVVDEGQFGVTMSALPAGTSALPTLVPGMGEPGDARPHDIQFNPPFRIRLAAAPGGALERGGILMGDRPLPNMQYLQFELRNTVGRFADDFEVIIEADAALHYEHVVQAVNAISHAGIKKINFAAPPPASN